ncbi:MAG: flagellar biosynthetic protein FliR [Planctomycetia bacterium]|nr:flagellar biosynthetic protein FliR [Planctomycetia bacterium]
MEYLLTIVNNLPVFMVIFSRVGGMLLFAPVFGNASVPLQVRVAIALMFTFILYPGVDKTLFTLPSNIILYTFVVLKEIAIGAVVGFAASIIFGAFTAAGYLISNQMGLDTASIVDPTSEAGEEEQTISIFYNMIAILIFLAINGHHWFIKSTAQSLEMIPLGSFKYTSMTFTKIITLFKSFLVMELRYLPPH